jgi:hypothetical protein
MLTCFGMFWNCDNFSRENTKFSKKITLLKKIIDSKLIVKTKWHIGAPINKIKKSHSGIFHLKIPLYENMFFWQKDPKKDNNLKCKVNTLIH